MLWSKLVCLLLGHRWIVYHETAGDSRQYCDRCGRAEGNFIFEGKSGIDNQGRFTAIKDSFGLGYGRNK